MLRCGTFMTGHRVFAAAGFVVSGREYVTARGQRRGRNLVLLQFLLSPRELG